MQEQFSYETKIKDGAYAYLKAGDINNDQKTDMIMVEYKHNNIEILTLNPQYKPVPATRFKLFEQKKYRGGDTQGEASVEPREMKIADVTGDGKKDMVIVIHDRIIVYPQD